MQLKKKAFLQQAVGIKEKNRIERQNKHLQNEVHGIEDR